MSFKPNRLTVLISTALLSYPTFASIVREDISYQIFRDFAENKGQFLPGATDIPIYTKDGQLFGNLNKAPMIDFSSANSGSGVATLVAPQYIASVKHNGGYQNVYFGGSGNNPDYLRQRYELIDRNNHNNKDLHIPRLHKYVTEVLPSEITSAGMGRNAYKDMKRFPIFYRMGSGNQLVRDAKGNQKWISGAYNFVTGGTVRTPVFSDHTFYNENGALYDPKNEILAMQNQPGDSGSPLFGWDTSLNRWVLVAVMHGIAGTTSNWWFVVDKPFAEKQYEEDRDPDINNSSDLVWQQSKPGESTLQQQDGISWIAHTANPDNALSSKQMLNSGKNVTFSGTGGTILLKNSIDHGAGGLTFQGNYTVSPETDQTWKGAGLIVDKDKTLTWQLNGVKNDFLHKLGEGTLRINAIGQNPGSLSVGDGTVILQQRPDQNGKVQAFETIQIASGRPTVVLGDNKQVQADNIYFGFRGGRLDLNGNDITFSRIRNVDNGAQIINSDTEKAANILVKGGGDPTVYYWQESRTGTPGTLYEYVNIYNNNRVDYFKLAAKNYGYFPAYKGSYHGWEYLGNDKAAAIEKIMLKENRAVFLGVLGENLSSKPNGKLNFTYRSPIAKGIYTLAGGSHLNGDITVENGTLLLSGRPTPHANNLIIDDDWITTQFTATTFKVSNDATLQLGNYANLQGNLEAGVNSRISLGYSKADNDWNNSWQCSLNDANGHVNCNQDPLKPELYATLPTALVNGNTTLAENAQLNLGKTRYSGVIQAHQTSHTLLQHDAVWQLTGDSRLGSLSAVSGAKIALNGDVEQNRFHTLTIDGDLSGEGQFEFNANLVTRKGDRVIVNGLAQGNYLLNLSQVSHAAAARMGFLPLLTLNHANQDWEAVNVSIPNHYLDIGAYRYILTRRNKSFALYNALLPAPKRVARSLDALTPEANSPTTSLPNETSDTAPTNTASNIDTAADNRNAPVLLTSADAEPGYSDVQQQWISRTVNTALSNHAAAINQLSKQQSLLNHYLQRLNAQNSGVWLNVDQQEMRYSSENYRTYKQRLTSQQLGADNVIAFNGGHWLTGLAFSHSRANNHFAESQSGNRVVHSISWYNKVIFDNQLYLTSAIQYHHLTAKLAESKIKQHAAGASVGLGHRWQLGSFGITPSADLSYYRMNAVDYRQEDIRFRTDKTNVWQLRSGIMLDKTFSIAANKPLKLYLTFNHVHNFHNPQKLYADNQAFKATLFKNRIESEIGAIFSLSKQFNLTVKGGYAHGDVIKSQFNGGVELKYIW